MPKILVIRFSSIGDIVLTTPVVRCIATQLPGAEIHYLTKPQFRSLLEPNPYIKRIHTLDKPLYKKSLELKSMGFDYVIDLHNNLRTRIIKSILDLPSFSFDKLNHEKWVAVKMKTNMLPDVHIVERYLDTAAPLGITNDGAGLDHFLPADISLPVTLPARFIAFAIGAQHATKRLPVEKITGICSKIGLPLLLLGGKEDAETAEIIMKGTGPGITSLCGRLSLQESACVVSLADKVITHDTGLMHIAAAFKKEIISVWGNTTPEFGMTPYYGNHPGAGRIFEVSGLDCRPCSKIGYPKCPLGHFNCMMMQDEQAIATAATR